MQWGLLVEFSCNSPTLYLIALLRALLVVRSFVLEWWVVATTLSRKQVIIPMNNDIMKEFIKSWSKYIVNINYALKTIKSNTIADFTCVDSKGIIITTNNVSSGLDFQEIEKYVKNSLSSDTDKVSSPRLPQLKLYLKIVSILFISEKTSNHVSLDKIKNVLKNNHLFNDIVLISKPRIIKVSPKSNMDIIWIDIWDTQNGLNAKKVINQRFNIGNYIATVWGANMNSGVPQCKNCWKWGHMAGVCRIQGAKCVKCNGPHLTKHYCHFA